MSVIVHKRAATVRPEPLDVHPGRLSLIDAVSPREGAAISAGVCEIWSDAPVDFHYDNYCGTWYLLEGHIALKEGERQYEIEPGDIVHIPRQAGLSVSFGTPSYGKFFFVTYPNWR